MYSVFFIQKTEQHETILRNLSASFGRTRGFCGLLICSSPFGHAANPEPWSPSAPPYKAGKPRNAEPLNPQPLNPEPLNP